MGKIVFYEADYLNGDGWERVGNSGTLSYSATSNRLNLGNNYWGLTLRFNVESINDKVFEGVGSYGGETVTLEKQ